MSKRSLLVRLVPCRCLRGEEEAVTSLDYSHCSLEHVPKEIFSFEKTLEELYLDANQIEELPKQLFNCQLLYRLSMPDNDLTVLPAAIANLTNLRELDVSKNSIQEFPENIKNCKVLAIVEASVNPISKLPEGFTQLLSLTQLYLNDAFLEFLPASFGRLTKLQILELRENQLKMLPKSMHKLTQLERLDLGSNEFTEVPEVLEQLSGIQELWIDGNRLTFLPGMVGTLKQLAYLDVSKNSIEMVDEQISGCDNLQDLLLSNNALTQLPGSIGSLKRLTTLKVDENQLMYLPDSIGGLTALEELDCSFNEIEALPASVGQCVNMRTFAADHNFLVQLPPEMGSWKKATVLFLHSNKLEFLPEEMGDMLKLKVINLSDNKLKNLPFTFTKLSQMTAMWLSENQSKALIPLQKEECPETQKTVLTNYMFPQQSRTEEYVPNSDSESFNPVLWEEQRKQRAQVAFECDEDKDERETPPREGNLKRYPTPYPDELKNMVKTAQSVAHRLKEEEGSGEEGRPLTNHVIGLQDVGVKVIEGPYPNGKAVEMESSAAGAVAVSESPRAVPEEQGTPRTEPLSSTEAAQATLNHEDTLEDSEELSSEEEDQMKMAEMRPPLIEISINQPKVLALGKDKKDDGKDADSLLDDTVANSNQNNSNCSSPSRMSDSVSLTTDSSQDNSLCTPEKEARMHLLPKHRPEDENLNVLPQKGTPVLQNNYNGSDQQVYPAQHQPTYDRQLSVEEKLALIDKSINNGVPQAYNKWDQINMNMSNTPDGPIMMSSSRIDNANAYLENGNGLLGPKTPSSERLMDMRGSDERLPPPPRYESVTTTTACAGVTASEQQHGLSHSTEELSPERRPHPPQPVTKSHSVSNVDAGGGGGMRLYAMEAEGGAYEYEVSGRQAVGAGGVGGAMGVGVGVGVAQGQSIVRSKSASLLNSQQPLQVHQGSSASSCDLLNSQRPPNVAVSGRGPPPQYKVQYSSSVPKESGWASSGRTPVPPEPYLPPHPQHSLANTNYSNRNQAPPYPMPAHQGAPPPQQQQMWAKQDPRLLAQQQRSTLQRQASNSSSISMSMEPRRVAVPEGDYLSYRDLQQGGPLPRGPLGASLAQQQQRPLSARTYSMDGPGMPRPHSARPPPHELPPERTMSVSDFSYGGGHGGGGGGQASPGKRPGPRVKSEHSLLDGPSGMGMGMGMSVGMGGMGSMGGIPGMMGGGGGGRGGVPADWRDQVMRHIEAKKMEKDEILWGPGPPAYPSDTQRKVPMMNGRPQMACGQPTMARHPSREQLIDYLMMKVNQHPQGHPPPPHDTKLQEIHVKMEKSPELGFSISGGIGGRGNPFRPEDNGIFVTRVQPDGPASKLLQPGDKIVQANGYNFVNIDHGNAVSLLKTFPNTVDLIIIREMAA
ncbi:erbin [Engraulis encrasicolus]|uniref:erbin n=1 Tax=Engraulis encrasicolus TaxID=184585 RepID=UPI002FD6A2E4